MRPHTWFLLSNLVLKDFRIRYRNMSLGILWSLVNPLVMMGVLTFIFTQVFTSAQRHPYPVFVLCGLVPFNFYSISFANGTTSIVENFTLIKRVQFPREVVPLASVLSNAMHFLAQAMLLLAFAVLFGYPPNRFWLLLPVIWLLEMAFILGLVLASSALDVYLRDVRYLVESSNVVMFWLVPIFYSFGTIPPRYAVVYEFNPLAAVVFATRDILLEGRAPANSLMINLAGVSVLVLTAGFLIFRRLKRRFADYL